MRAVRLLAGLPESRRVGLWLGGVALVVLLAWYGRALGAAGWEVELVQGVQGLDVPGLRDTSVLLTTLGGEPYSLVLIGAMLATLTVTGFRRESFLLGLAAIASLSATWLKDLVARPRPTPAEVEVVFRLGDTSFPSGHALGTALILGFLCYLLPSIIGPGRLCRALQLAAAAVILLMGLARVDLGAHWPTDVLGA